MGAEETALLLGSTRTLQEAGPDMEDSHHQLHAHTRDFTHIYQAPTTGAS